MVGHIDRFSTLRADICVSIRVHTFRIQDEVSIDLSLRIEMQLPEPKTVGGFLFATLFNIFLSVLKADLSVGNEVVFDAGLNWTLALLGKKERNSEAAYLRSIPTLLR